MAGGCRLSRSSLTAPERLRRDLERVREKALECAYLAKRIGKPYEDAYEASLSTTSTGGLAPGKKGFVPSFPTEDVALSGIHGAMRYKVRLSAKRVQRAIDELELAQGDLLEAFLNSDPLDPHRQPVLSRNGKRATRTA